jgi:hypothetical protein
VEDLRAEPAADVGGDDPQLVLGDVQRERAHQQPDHVRVLRRGVQRVVIGGGVVVADRGARLDRVGREPVVGQVELDDVGRLGERGVGRRQIAEVPVVAQVALGLVVDQRRRRLDRVGEQADRGQHVVVDVDQTGGRLGRGLGRRDHHGDRIADVADLALGERGVRRLDHGRAVLVLDQPAARQPAEPVGGDVVAGEHSDHAGGGLGGGGVDLLDLGVRVHRAHEHGVGLVRQDNVVDVVALAEQEPTIFLALDGCADALVGRHHLPPRMPAAPALTALTMLW